jgi:hypothetical protein
MEVDQTMHSFLKRVLPAALVFLVALSSTASAKWVTKEVQWRISNQGSPFNASAIYVRDTLRTAIGPVDTTASFTLDDACPPPRGMGAPAGVAIGGPSSFNAFGDTTTVAWLLLQADSSAAPTAGLTSVTALIDGRVAGLGPATTLARGWVKADSALVNGAAGGTMILADESVSIPIRSISPYGNIFRWGALRARITGAGTSLSAARVFLRYWSCGDEH